MSFTHYDTVTQHGSEAGVPIRSIALCGHKRIETTLRYAKATDAALTDAMAAIQRD